MPQPWFKNKNPQRLTITRYTSISKQSIEQTLQIDDTSVVHRLVERINTVAADGDMMISFGPDAEHVELIFTAEEQEERIHFYSKKIKTPSTGFNSYRSQQELSVYRDIDVLLFPDVSKPILKIKNIEIQFPAFGITYLGSIYRDEAPVSLSFSTDRYLIRDKNGIEQLVEIISGQLPPPSFDFTIENIGFVLNSFQTTSGDLLYPDYFEILTI